MRECNGGTMESSDAIRGFITEPIMQQRLAKLIVLECFRNSHLEDLHAGIAPDSAAGDYSDVVVNGPYGAIPWPQVSRLNDDEMKRLMIEVVNRTYRLVMLLRSGDYSDVVVNGPYGAIPWPQVSRLNDDEMKRLMIEVVNRTYRLVHRLFDDREGGVLLLRLAERDPAPHWQTPTLGSH